MKYLPQLREIGVAALKIDGIEVALRPQMLQEQPGVPPQPQGRDSMTMGLGNGLKVPTLRDRHG